MPLPHDVYHHEHRLLCFACDQRKTLWINRIACKSFVTTNISYLSNVELADRLAIDNWNYQNRSSFCFCYFGLFIYGDDNYFWIFVRCASNCYAMNLVQCSRRKFIIRLRKLHVTFYVLHFESVWTLFGFRVLDLYIFVSLYFWEYSAVDNVVGCVSNEDAKNFRQSLHRSLVCIFQFYFADQSISPVLWRWPGSSTAVNVLSAMSLLSSRCA